LPDTVPIDRAVSAELIDAEDAERYAILSVTDAGSTPAPELAARATAQALARARCAGDDLSLVLYVSVWHQGPHGWCPQYYVQNSIGASRATAAEVRQGCMGMFSALELGAAHLMADAGHPATLVTSGENFNSPLLDRWRFAPHYVMGDGGSAVVLSNHDGFARLRSINAMTLPEYEALHRDNEPLFPPGSSLGRPLDFGKNNRNFMAATAPGDDGPLRVVATHDELISRGLDEAGIKLEDVTRVGYVHGSRERIEAWAMEPLGLPLSRSTWEYSRTVGHIGASDQLVALEHLVSAGELGAGDHYLMLGVGPGLNIACAVIEILRTPDWVETAA
jgi:3-oxoacyl-[acyl-carrier-protein] synthase-3